MNEEPETAQKILDDYFNFNSLVTIQANALRQQIDDQIMEELFGKTYVDNLLNVD